MKKTIGVCILSSLLVLLPIFAGAGQAGFTVEPLLYLNAGAAKPVYTAADSESDVIGELGTGEAFELLSQTDAWAEILVFSEAGDRLPGWVSPEGLRQKTAEDGAALAIVNSPDPAVRVHLRTGTGGSSKSLGKYYNGVVAQVLEQPRDNRVRVRIGTLEGYMETQSLLLDAPVGSVLSFIPAVLTANPDAAGLTLRSGQSYQSDKQGAVSNGQPVRVLGVTEEFAHVITQDGRVGFMMASGLSPQPVYADIGPAAFIPRPEGSVSVIENPGGQGAHLRTRGSTASDSLGLYPNGTEVIVTGGTTYWKQVWVDGKTGYMMAQLIKGFVPEEFQGN